MHYSLIYSPSGEPVEVPVDKVGDLVLNKGWTRRPTTTVPVPVAARLEVFEAPPGADNYRTRKRRQSTLPTEGGTNDEQDTGLDR